MDLDLKAIRQQFEDDEADEKELRDSAKKCLRFVGGDQWEDAEKSRRISNGRPALTFNRCHTFVQQVANEARQNKPQIKYIPAEENDKETAQIYEGLARHIQYDSDAQVAYETALEYSAGGGFGYYRFLTEYCDKYGDDPATVWDQDLKVKAVLDPFSVYGILMASCMGVEPDHAFVVEEMPTAVFKNQYPNAKDTISFAEENKNDAWTNTETVRVAEYWYCEDEQEEVKHPEDEKRVRMVNKRTVKFCKITGQEIIPGTETTWVGKCIPIIPVLGKQVVIDGKPKLFSVISFQMGPQQLINVYKTRIAETLMDAPIQPYMVAEGQITGHEAEWKQLNSKRLPYLTYKPMDVRGELAPPPQRQVFEPPIGSLSEAAAQEIDDMKATAGIYDASLGAKANETSGIALQRRAQQSSITNLHFMDNLERAFKRGGYILAECLPKVYTTPRMVRILGDDEAPKIVKINQQTQDGKTYQIGGDGVAKYDVVITMGKSFSTKRMESFDFALQLVQAHPESMGIIGDILLANSDMAGADKMAERYKKVLPPALQDQEGDNNPDALKAKLAAMSVQHEQLTQAVQQQAQEIETKKAELDSRERMNSENNATKLLLEDIKAQNAGALEALIAEMQAVQASVAQMHDFRMAQNSQEHELGMSGQQFGMDQMGAEADHSRAMEQNDQLGQQQAAQAQQAHANALDMQANQPSE